MLTLVTKLARFVCDIILSHCHRVASVFHRSVILIHNIYDVSCVDAMFQRLALQSPEPASDLAVNFIPRLELLESQFLVVMVSCLWILSVNIITDVDDMGRTIIYVVCTCFQIWLNCPVQFMFFLIFCFSFLFSFVTSLMFYFGVVRLCWLLVGFWMYLKYLHIVSCECCNRLALWYCSACDSQRHDGMCNWRTRQHRCQVRCSLLHRVNYNNTITMPQLTCLSFIASCQL